MLTCKYWLNTCYSLSTFYWNRHTDFDFCADLNSKTFNCVHRNSQEIMLRYIPTKFYRFHYINSKPVLSNVIQNLLENDRVHQHSVLFYNYTSPATSDLSKHLSTEMWHILIVVFILHIHLSVFQGKLSFNGFVTAGFWWILGAQSSFNPTTTPTTSITLASVFLHQI